MTTSTLLGYLARFASFTMQSEVLCTQGLGHLLQTHREARAAVASEVEKRTGLRVEDSLRWIPEPVLPDGSRPDLEARATREGDEVPVINVEAKLGALLTAAQLWAYVNHLLTSNTKRSALMVLVPRARVTDCTKVVQDTFNQPGSGPWQVENRCNIAVISWYELFETFQSGKNTRFQYEVEQLKEMYRVLTSGYVAPVASEEDLREWKSSETDFAKLADQVTAILTRRSGNKLLPVGTEVLEGDFPDSEPVEYYRRYVCPYSDTPPSCYSIGARDSFARWLTPIWMRFHKDTGNFGSIRRRIKASSLRWLESNGHVWMPLDVPRQVSGEQIVETLVEQAQEILRVACQPECDL